MLTKFGSIVVSGAGSLGGHTLQHSKGGSQMRTKPINKKQPTAAQSLIRFFNTQLQQGWRQLSEASRDEWNIYPRAHSIFNKNGEKFPLSGHSLWMKYNFDYISDGLPFIDSPFDYKAVRIGPELIINGGFDGQPPWFIQGSWTISGGTANYLDSANRYIQNPNVIMQQGLDYKLSFNVQRLVGSHADITVTNELTELITGSSYLPYSNDHHDFFFNCAFDVADFRFWANVSSSGTFSVDNVSVRQIF